MQLWHHESAINGAFQREIDVVFFSVSANMMNDSPKENRAK